MVGRGERSLPELRPLPGAAIGFLQAEEHFFPTARPRPPTAAGTSALRHGSSSEHGHSLACLREKRQRAAPQDTRAATVMLESRTASWSAPALRSFARKHVSAGLSHELSCANDNINCHNSKIQRVRVEPGVIPVNSCRPIPKMYRFPTRIVPFGDNRLDLKIV